MWTVPSLLKDAQELSEWKATHNQIVGALRTMVKAPLQQELKSINNTEVAWRNLKEKIHSKGIIAKLECLTSTNHSRIVPDTPASTTIADIKDALGLVFEGGAPMIEEWLVILLLNSLSDGNYDWLRKDLLGFMTNTKIAIMSKDIIEQIVTEHHEGTKAIESTLTSKQ